MKIAERRRRWMAAAKPAVKSIVKHYQMANVSDSAVVLAYYALLSIFPALLFIGSLLPYLNIGATRIMAAIEPVVPAQIYAQLKPIIASFLGRGSGGVLSIGAIVTLWSASRAIAALQRTVNQAYGVAENQNAIINRVVSFFWLLVLMVLVVALILFFSFGQLILAQLTPILDLPSGWLTTVTAVKWPLTSVATFLILVILFYFVPTARVKLRYVWPGAAVSTIGILALSQAFSLYVKYFSGNIDGYKTIGTFIILMFWLDAMGMILLFGAVLNAALQDHSEGEIEETHQLSHFIQRQRTRRNQRPRR